MKIEDLEAFVAAAKSDSFFLQDAYSNHVGFVSPEIDNLEQELGTFLIEREGKNIGCLTEAGKELLDEAPSLIREYRYIFRRMDKFRRRDTRPIVIGTLPILRQYHLERVFSRFEQEEGIHVIIEEQDTKTLLRGLADNYYDALIIKERQVGLTNIEKIPLASDELAAVMSNDHPLAEEPGIRVQDLTANTLYLTEPQDSVFGRAWKLLKEHHISTDYAEVETPDQILKAVKEGKGITVMPVSTLKTMGFGELAAVPFKPRQGVNIVFVLRKDSMHTVNMEKLIETIRQRAKPLPI